MSLDDLKKPFPADEIEWRIGQCGKKGNGQIWAMCLAYVTGRAIMDRLDDVCGLGGWRVDYHFVPGAADVTAGVIARISIKVGDEWVTKEDGAEQTDIESFKGGLSSALKRAGSAWGIGRYLYSLESGFAQIVDQGTAGAKWGKTKEGASFYWVPPKLPEWALPSKVPSAHKPKGPEDSRPKSNGIHADLPGAEDGGGEGDGVYRPPFGKYIRKTFDELFRDPKVGPEGVKSYIRFLEASAQKKGVQIEGEAAEFIERASEAIALLEHEWAEQAGARS
jgi:hypothetical protein